MEQAQHQQQVWFVTGSSRGLGRALVTAALDAGDLVVATARRPGQLDDLVKRYGDDRIHPVALDVTDAGAARSAVDAAVSRFGRIDVLVNNAARAIGGIVDEIEEDDWNRVISNNLTSVWRFMKCVVPIMRSRGGGSIVNMSSVQSLRGFHGWPAYAAAKGGINALTQQTAVELAPAKIRVNAVAPGTIMTPLNEKVFREAADPQELIDRWNAAHPIGRFGEAEEVAELVLFLASDRSSFITGEIIRVDGGLAVKGD
jgi:NAD(P)-dependent dehydrogenase (short-subunit alcohol dehydrogenase family)